ncbi:MAG: hypothetical protein A2475_14325 [Ignavibacteria bacterium RIFOXYC2_FULL_35_21]|nr:MAG: hypothetical protein A2220_12635 [Ignavibacteria bacterium RIFOXYA2_FULL_35_10]OGV24782.1 MAG: hypothetical protein A2475_14325 [Ignavibacteria bacterium RIFOXYC2_FULL_35_21]
MNKQDIFLYIILDKIAKTKGWGLFFEPGLNKILNSKFLLQLEKAGYIIINGKNFTEEQIVEYHYLDFTDKGKELYKKLKNAIAVIN